MLGGALLAFLAAHAVFFALHLPNRYVVVAIPVVLALGVVAVADRVASALFARRPSLATPRARRRVAWVAAVAALAFFAARNGFDLVAKSKRPRDDDWRAVLQALESGLEKP